MGKRSCAECGGPTDDGSPCKWCGGNQLDPGRYGRLEAAVRAFVEGWEDGAVDLTLNEGVLKLRAALDEFTSDVIRPAPPPPGMVAIEKGVGGL